MGVWIEMIAIMSCMLAGCVAPFVGVWIEMHQNNLYLMRSSQVAPFVGVWIEIGRKAKKRHDFLVAPFVGVWIEI